ncbi:hypothetical protein CRG98_045820 [Punica granatum]|uniref:Uncharacterized protein n=1 Tax=Punica granatum TaxID=22663 RepID=A0A2I0HQ00_PUNGR|nr:hypothetical protein CRG98_045820 [Punica granatum]
MEVDDAKIMAVFRLIMGWQWMQFLYMFRWKWNPLVLKKLFAFPRLSSPLSLPLSSSPSHLLLTLATGLPTDLLESVSARRCRIWPRRGQISLARARFWLRKLTETHKPPSLNEGRRDLVTTVMGPNNLEVEIEEAHEPTTSLANLWRVSLAVREPLRLKAREPMVYATSRQLHLIVLVR